MALTNKQVQGVCNMFANAFIHAESEEERKENTRLCSNLLEELSDR